MVDNGAALLAGRDSAAILSRLYGWGTFSICSGFGPDTGPPPWVSWACIVWNLVWLTLWKLFQCWKPLGDHEMHEISPRQRLPGVWEMETRAQHTNKKSRPTELYGCDRVYKMSIFRSFTRQLLPWGCAHPLGGYCCWSVSVLVGPSAGSESKSLSHPSGDQLRWFLAVLVRSS